nr:integrase, catalytic region, zinc finger, CCHC-type, peptidase aspartic, catalytic [Tanacetum cinerariifolium]
VASDDLRDALSVLYLTSAHLSTPRTQYSAAGQFGGVTNLEGVDLLKGDRSTKLYTINLHEIASASPICLMARASSTKSWLWHQRLSHLNFDTINDLARNDLVAGIKLDEAMAKSVVHGDNGKSTQTSYEALEEIMNWDGFFMHRTKG